MIAGFIELALCQIDFAQCRLQAGYFRIFLHRGRQQFQTLVVQFSRAEGLAQLYNCFGHIAVLHPFHETKQNIDIFKTLSVDLRRPLQYRAFLQINEQWEKTAADQFPRRKKRADSGAGPIEIDIFCEFRHHKLPGEAAVEESRASPKAERVFVAGAGLAPAVTVSARDALGNVADGYTGSVTVAITNGTGAAGATLSGTKTVAATAGVAMFAGLSIDKVGTGYTLSASGTGLTGVTSATFNITAGPASVLVISVQRSSTAAGTRANGAILTGTTVVNALNGVATYSDLRIDESGSGFKFAAPSAGTAGVNSASFTVKAGPRLSSTSGPNP